MCVFVCEDPRGYLAAWARMYASMPMLVYVCVCVAEVLIFFVSGAQMQGPSSSTSPDSAVCTGLWEVGMGCKRGFLGGWMPLVVLLKRGALTERARGTTHSRLANDISQSRPSGKTQWSQLVEFL